MRRFPHFFWIFLKIKIKLKISKCYENKRKNEKKRDRALLN